MIVAIVIHMARQPGRDHRRGTRLFDDGRAAKGHAGAEEIAMFLKEKEAGGELFRPAGH